MKQLLLFLFFGFVCLDISAQIVQAKSERELMSQIDTTQYDKNVSVNILGETSYKDYKVISILNDTTLIDTVLNIENDYKLNYRRKDNFELMEFGNQGQTFNKLGYTFTDNSVYPSMGFGAKQYNYYDLNDIKYFYVPTPTSEMMYRRGIQQGQVLDAMLTANTSRQLNLSASYKGLRSLGRYQHELSSHGNFRFTFNYHTKNKRYYLRGHIYSFDLFNEQNGGLTPASIGYFENDDADFKDRGRMDVNYTDADNIFEGKRYFLDQNFTLVSNQPFEKRVKKPKKNKNPFEENLAVDSLNIESEILIDSISVIDSLGVEKTIIKNDSINIVENDSITKTTTIDSSLIVNAKDSISVIDSLEIEKTIIKNDSINIVENDSIAKTISIDSSLVVNAKDSISPNLKIADSTSIKDSLEVSIDTTLVAEVKPLLNLQIGNFLLYEAKHYRFNKTSTDTIFGESYTTPISDHTSYQRFNTQFYLQMNSDYVGSLRIKINYFSYLYRYNSILYFDDYTISDRLQGSAVSVGADWTKKFGKVFLNVDATTILFGDISGNSLKAKASFEQEDLFNFEGYAEIASKTPSFNKMLYQSDYKDYNWQNSFINEEVFSVGAAFNSKKWVTLSASYNVIDNYTYFNQDSRPEQATESLIYLRAKLIKAITVGKFTLDNTIMYQSVTQGESFFRVPEWTTRNTLFYATDMFKGDPLYLQTGITFRYFTAFKMNAYNPLIAEFTLQDTEEIGDFPVFDFFVNLRVQRTRMYFKFENIAAKYTGRNYYSAPKHPYRDFTFRFGLVWNFFI